MDFSGDHDRVANVPIILVGGDLLMSSNDDPHQPSPGAISDGPPVPFHTEPASSHNERGSSTTSGLSGTSQKFNDGTIVTEAVEELHAKRTDGLDGSLIGNWRRVQKGNTFAIRQTIILTKDANSPTALFFLTATESPPPLLKGLQLLQ
jgi:hypothetical protein